MKLTLKHIAPYLPYDLQCYGASDIWIIHSMSIEYISFYNGAHLQENSFEDFISDYSILLRPLSDLTKEIEVDGERFVPKEEMINKNPQIFGAVDFFENMASKYYTWDNCYTWNYSVFRQLCEWHFDVFGLIEQGLAIDINTLNK